MLSSDTFWQGKSLYKYKFSAFSCFTILANTFKTYFFLQTYNANIEEVKCTVTVFGYTCTVNTDTMHLLCFVCVITSLD